MYVSELVKELESLPQDVWVDVMFPNDTSVYAIKGLELYNLSQGQQRAVIEIVDEVPLRAV